MTGSQAAGMQARPRELRQLFGGRARLLEFPDLADARGSLVPVEFSELPFPPRRAFVVRDVPAGTARGRHAHRRSRQMLICLSGRLAVRLTCEAQDETVVLHRASEGLLIEPGVWAEQTFLDAGTVLLVLSDQPYDPQDYLAGAGP